ncbi:Sel1 repeat-containing protein [Rhizobiales bacterium GAS188]|nr:Sel1 repeat-containing protein [Rhizobiales bacterium GAS188]
MAWPWEALGIARTSDRGAIRRAYASRLKQTRPDEDTEGFVRLRAAYEAAMARASAAAKVPEIRPPASPRAPPPGDPSLDQDAPSASSCEDREVEPKMAEDPGRRDVSAANAEPAPQTRPHHQGEDAGEAEPRPAGEIPRGQDAAFAYFGDEREIELKVAEAMARQDVSAAAETLESARVAGGLSLSVEMALSNRLLFLLATDRTLPGFSVFEAAIRLGWYGQSEGHLSSQLVDRLQARIAAERWLEALRDKARSPRLYLGGQQAAAARLLLGRGRMWLSWLLPPEPPLGRLLAEYRFHEWWVGPSFDSERIGSLGRLVSHRFSRVGGAIVLALVLLSIYWAFGLGLLRAPGAFWPGILFVFALRGYARPIIVALAIAVVVIGIVRVVTPQTDQAVQVQPMDPIAELVRLAEAGSAAAALDLGERYARGDAVAKDPATAAKWFERALAGRPRAAAWLAYLHETGNGVPQDLAKARSLYLDAATRGDPAAQANLAFMMVSGRGGPADPAEAFQWYLRAARQGNGAGMNGVGFSYLNGQGVAQDAARGALWLQAAADAGQPNAMHTLASLYLQGTGVPASPAMAYRWLTLALRNYRADDSRRAAAQAMLTQAAALLDDQQKATVDAELRSWRPQAARPPEQP